MKERRRKKPLVVYEIGWEDDDQEHVVWIRSSIPITLVPGCGEDGRNPITGIYIRETHVPPYAAGVDFEVKK